jgi:hypothetical protein
MFVVQALSMGVLVLALEMPGDQQLAHLLAVGGTLFYVFTFALGAGPATALIIPELCTTRLRAKTMAVSLCTHWVCIFLTCRYLVLSDLRSFFNVEDSFEVQVYTFPLFHCMIGFQICAVEVVHVHV